MGREIVPISASAPVLTVSNVMPCSLAIFRRLNARPNTPMEPVMVPGSAMIRRDAMEIK